MFPCCGYVRWLLIIKVWVAPSVANLSDRTRETWQKRLDGDPTTLENKGPALTACHGLFTSSSLHAHTFKHFNKRFKTKENRQPNSSDPCALCNSVCSVHVSGTFFVKFLPDVLILFWSWSWKLFEKRRQKTLRWNVLCTFSFDFLQQSFVFL